MGEVKEGVHEKGDDVEREQEVAQVTLMPKIVFDMIPFGGEDVVAGIFDFPVSASSFSDIDDTIAVNLMVRDPTIGVQLLAPFVIGDGQGEPIDKQSILPSANRHI